jgi:branched-subunit amino acid aminotransferase/4-amino-4-deoxychorismate lyase
MDLPYSRERMMAGWSETWTFVDGEWLKGNPPLTGPRSHAFWLASSVFDGGTRVRRRDAGS